MTCSHMCRVQNSWGSSSVKGWCRFFCLVLLITDSDWLLRESQKKNEIVADVMLNSTHSLTARFLGHDFC